MSQSSDNGGITFACLLAILFITLKLVGVIGWSWWWVLAPIWIPLGFVVLVCLIVLFYCLMKGN